MSVLEYKQNFYEAVLDLLWSQWTALGIPGQESIPESETVLDPEALLVFSAGFARMDQRLYDLILDWLRLHSAQINLQRLKALHAGAEWRDTASLGYICSVIAETDPVRWRKFAESCSGAASDPPAALFYDRDQEPEKFIPGRDPLALRCGFLRNIRRESSKISARLPNTPATLLLRMRGIFGVSARAEVILILAVSSLCRVQEIALRSGFIWKSVQDVLEELASGGFVSSVEGPGRGKQYFLTDPERVLRLFDLGAPVFWNWPNLYDAVGLLWRSCSNPFWAKVSPETVGNELRTLYREKLRGKLLASGCPVLAKTNLDLREFPELLRQICR